VKEGSKGTVLIVDDSALIRKLLRKILEDEGYTVVCEASNGAEAVEEYEAYRPDVVTLDITMPIMDGVEALKQIRQINPSAKAFMVTAAGQQKKVIEALKNGAMKFIVKPFSKDEVLTSFEEAFKK
jgi:DNA-binding NtrC family response regulator